MNTQNNELESVNNVNGRKNYPAEFKDQVIAVYKSGIYPSVAKCAEAYGVNENTLHGWLAKYTFSPGLTEWQNRPLESRYPILFLDCLVVKIQENKSIINKSIYLALGIGTDGNKELLACGYHKMKVLNSG